MDKEIFIEFGEWLPDQPSNTPGIVVSAENVLGEVVGYTSFPRQLEASGLMSQSAVLVTPVGIGLGVDLSNNHYVYAGASTDLIRKSASAWDIVSRLSGGAYTTPTNGYWEFAQFGDRLYAVNGAQGDTPQVISVGAATRFQNLSGVNAPKATHIATVKDFVVMGNLSSSATEPQHVRWCAINNPNSWTPDATTLADFQQLPGEGGPVQKIVGGEYGLIFQERAIFRMTFIGSPVIFQFDKIHNNIGTVAPNSVVSNGSFTYFFTDSGFFMYDGERLQPIGEGKVDRYFFSLVVQANWKHIRAAIDPLRKIVMWTFATDGTVKKPRAMVYHYGSGKWSVLNFPQEVYVPFYGSTEATADYRLCAAVSASSGSRIVQYRYANDAMSAILTTGDLHLNQQMDGKACITEIRPAITGTPPQFGAIGVSVYSRDHLGRTASDNIALVSAFNHSTGSVVVKRASARYHRVGVNITASATTASFDSVTGVWIKYHNESWR